MPQSTFLSEPRRWLAASAMLLALVAVLFGGASRTDVVAPLLVRLTALGMIVWIAWTRIPQAGAASRFVWVFWAALFALPLIQLIPLPWSVWTALPGREMATQIYTVIGEQPWQPISLTPDRTLNALFALIPPFAAFLLGIRLDDAGRDRLLLLICLLAVSSAVIGLLQLAGGPGNGFYFYAITNADASVGWFSNANHNALMICGGVSLIFYWIAGHVKPRAPLPGGKIWFGAVGLLCLLVSLPGTSSRAGMLLSVFAVAAGLALLPFERLGIARRTLWTRIAPVVAIVGAGIAWFTFADVFRDEGLGGLFEDGRARNVGDFLDIARVYLPLGSGLGSFDPIYRIFENVESIELYYLNNAHNEPAQFLIEAGAGGIILLAAFLGWWARTSWSIWRTPRLDGRQTRQARVATAITAMLILHSLVDYPLRTGSLSVVFAFCIAIMAVRPIGSGRARGLALTEYLGGLDESELAFSRAGTGHMRAG